MQQIAQQSTIARRNTLFLPRDEFDELRDIAQLHPDFAKGGRLKKMASMRYAIKKVLEDDNDSIYDSEQLEKENL